MCGAAAGVRGRARTRGEKDELLILTAALLADCDLQGAKSRKKLSRHVNDSKAQDE
jgi:hypothetical protein